MDVMMSVDDVSFFAATNSNSTKQLTRAGRDAETLVCDCSPTLITDTDR